MEEAQIKQIIERQPPTSLCAPRPTLQDTSFGLHWVCQLFSGRRSCQSRAHAGLWAVYCLG